MPSSRDGAYPGAVNGLAAARLVLGVVMLARPTWLTRPLGVDRWTAERLAWLPRMVGGREVALGLGTLVMTRGGRPGRRAWLAAGALADAADAAALLTAARRGHVSRPGGIAAVATALAAASVGTREALGAGLPH